MRRMPEHGTTARYRRPCRCEPCRTAHNTYQTERRHRLGIGRPRAEYLADLHANRNPTHGRISTYNAGCRCDECRETARTTQARRRAAKRPA